MKNFKRKHFITLATVAVMIFTNPLRSSFASYLHRTELDGIGREFNGLIFSVYSKSDVLTMSMREKELFLSTGNMPKIKSTRTKYIGILGNFFKAPTL